MDSLVPPPAPKPPPLLVWRTERTVSKFINFQHFYIYKPPLRWTCVFLGDGDFESLEIAALSDPPPLPDVMKPTQDSTSHSQEQATNWKMKNDSRCVSFHKTKWLLKTFRIFICLYWKKVIMLFFANKEIVLFQCNTCLDTLSGPILTFLCVGNFLNKNYIITNC